MDSGNYASIGSGKAVMTHAEVHEAYLLEEIKESKRTVTVINTKKNIPEPKGNGTTSN